MSDLTTLQWARLLDAGDVVRVWTGGGPVVGHMRSLSPGTVELAFLRIVRGEPLSRMIARRDVRRVERLIGEDGSDGERVTFWREVHSRAVAK